MTVYNAWSLAKAWNSVAQAQSDDKARPALYRTTLIEQYPQGLRLVATDSYLLLKAWVPSVDYRGAAEPGRFDLPEESTVCIDRDRRVVSLMTYAMAETKADGQDTPLTMTLMLGTMKPGAQGELEGMTQQAVSFQFEHEYDERIETPIFDGFFPTWKNLWYAHQIQATTTVSFGANGLLRIGKLSQVWDKASIRFQMGGALGVAKFTVQAPDVNVEGLAMPIRDADSTDEVVPVPPSEEGIHAEFSDALDDFLSEVLATEVHDPDDPVMEAARRAQLAAAAGTCMSNGSADTQLLIDALGVSVERANELLEGLVDLGILVSQDDGKFTIGEDAAEICTFEFNDEPGDGDEPEPV